MTKNPELRLSLARHGLLLISLSIALDYSTSWVMMSFLGASAEGTALVRDFYERRTTGALLALLASQEIWILLLMGAAAAFLVYRRSVTPKNKTLIVLYQYLGLPVGLAWLMGAGRMMLGPTSNVSALIGSVYGGEVGSWSYTLMFLGVGVIVIFDFLWTYRRATRKDPRVGTVFASSGSRIGTVNRD